MKNILTIIFTLCALSMFGQCPVTAPNSDFSNTDGGAPGCTPGSYKPEGAVTTTASCASFTGSNTCGLIWYADTYSLTCGFCVSFDFSLSPATSDGIALSMASFNNTNFPCSTPIGCNEGGNIGYNNINTSNTNIDGALTVEVDVFDNSADGDDDPTCNHVSVVSNGDNSTSEAQACEPGGVTWDDGATHALEMCWDPSTNELTVSIDGTLLITLNSDIATDYFGGNTDVNFAFSSGYNSSFVGTNTACNWTVTPTTTTPVELLEFNAVVTNSKTNLEWITADEKRHDKFIIERSVDGEVFIELAEVYKEQATDGIYNFLDNTPEKGSNYYRLKQIDINGDYKYMGGVKMVIINGYTPRTYISNKKIIVENIDDDYSLKIFTIDGKLLNTYNKSDNNDSVDISDKESGVYLIQIQTNSQILTQKMYL